MIHNRKQWEKGNGGFLEWTLCMVGLTFIVIMLVGFYLFSRGVSKMEDTINLIARDIVACESIEEAKTLAQERADFYMTGYEAVIVEDSVKADVVYTPGSKQEWRKGNFVTVFLSANINCRMPVLSGTKEVSAVIMIERSGSHETTE